MKNLYNIGFVFLLLVVLGCNCQDRLQELAQQGKTPTSSSPSVSNTSTTPTSSSSPSTTTSSSGLTMDKYNQIKNGMSYQEVVAILGEEGTQTMSSGEGRYKVESYKWEGEQFQFVTVIFTGDKVSSKVQANLK